MKRSFIACLLIAATFIIGRGVAEATTITYTTNYPLTQPDWSDTLQLPKFDPAKGALTKITITNIGEISGSIGVENKNTSLTRTINAQLAAALQATLPGGVLLTSHPTNAQSFTLPKYDGVVDYAGTSGRTLNNVTAFNQVIYLVNAADLARYEGTGLFDILVDTTDSSFASGGGSTASNFSNAAGLTLTVQYDYVSPEPSCFILLGAGLLGMTFIRRKMQQV